MYLQRALWRSVALLPALICVAAGYSVAHDIIYNGGVCDLSENDDGGLWGSFVVESQAAFDATLGNCTTIIGTLYISKNYTGSLVMNNVMNMTEDIGSLTSYEEDFTTGAMVATYPAPLFTSLQADNLVWLRELYLLGVPALNSISMAKLDNIEKLTVYSRPAMSLSFPRLKNCTDILIEGGFTSLNFDQLANVDRSLTISSRNGSSDRSMAEYYHNSTLPQSTPMDIKFPSLVNATYVELWGNISSIYMPNLATSIPPDFPNSLTTTYYGKGISIDNWGQQPLNVSIPKLWNTTGIGLTGSLGIISLPALSNFTGGYTIDETDFSHPLDINFEPLRTAGVITLKGDIRSVNISSIESISYLSVSSTRPFNCGQLGAQYAKIKNSTTTDTHQLHAMGFLCSDTPKPKFRLSKGGRIGVGVAAGILGFALLVWFIIWRKKKNAGAEANRLPSYHLARLDPAPKYPHPTTPEESTGGGENGAITTPTREEPPVTSHPQAYDALPGQAGENEGG